MAFNVPSGGDEYELEAQINIIPMVDIMLVLLIIFMVAAPLMNDSVDVHLPKAKAKSTGIEEESVILAIQKDQTVYIGKTPVALDEISKKLTNMFANRERKEVFIRADEAVTHGFVIRVMALIQAAGIFKVSFMTDPSK